MVTLTFIVQRLEREMSLDFIFYSNYNFFFHFKLRLICTPTKIVLCEFGLLFGLFCHYRIEKFQFESGYLYFALSSFSVEIKNH